MAEDDRLNSKTHKAFNKFMKATGPDLDEVATVLRSHLLIEFYLDQCLLSRILKGYLLMDIRLGFPQKLAIVEALDFLPPETVDSIKKLNSVRNRCAHDLEYIVTEGDVDTIGRPYGPAYRRLKKMHPNSLKLLLHWTLVLPVTNLISAVENPTSSWKSTPDFTELIDKIEKQEELENK